MSPKRIKVFLDSSVIFSALLSFRGASAGIITLAKEGKIRTLVSGYVVDEVKRSLARKASVLLPHFENLLQAEVLTVVADPTAEEVAVASRIISDPKDAPIIAAAMRHGVDYLVTLDRKDFLLKSEVGAESGINIFLPRDFLHFLREAAKI